MSAEFHLYLPQMRMTMEAIVGRARDAERAGFAGIALMDHLAPPGASDAPMFEALATAGWLAAHSERLIVSPLVLCDSFRHPAVLAKQAVTLDHASGGRFELGIGWGSVADEIEAYGVGDASPGARVARLAETLEVLRRLWSGETVRFDGAYHRLRAVLQKPTPLRSIPIVIGGTGPRTLELVAAHADWWNVPADRVADLDAMRARAGAARVSAQQVVALVPSEADRDEVTRLARRRFGWARESGMAIGTPDELTARFRGLAERGVERFYVWFTDFAPSTTLERFGEVVASLA